MRHAIMIRKVDNSSLSRLGFFFFARLVDRDLKFFTCAKEGHMFFCDKDLPACARITSRARFPAACREGAKAAQLYPCALLKRLNHAFQNNRNNAFNIAPREVLIIFVKVINKFGS